MISDKGAAAVEIVILTAIAVAAAFIYSTSLGGIESLNRGFACPSGYTYHIGPGRLTATYIYSDALCGYNSIELPLNLNLARETTCTAGRREAVILPFADGKPVYGNYSVGYASTSMGVRPAYIYERSGAIPASACAPLMVPGKVVIYYDKSTGLILKAESYTTVNGTNYKLRDLEINSYQVMRGSLAYKPGLLLGAVYAAIGGVIGASIALIAKRLLDLL
ncbi:MAG: hypothetical protein LRS46_02905 [Desulfurococcales archaeon]|nr:hypothetical protein [Desulfurococcales archaeon]